MVADVPGHPVLALGRLCWLAGAFGVCASQPAWAAELADRFRYQAPPECPSRRALTEAVEARLPPHSDAAHASGPAIEIEIVRRTGILSATLVIGAETPRRLEGDTCQDVVDALAVIIATELGQERRTARGAARGALPDVRPSEAEPDRESRSETPIAAPGRPGSPPAAPRKQPPPPRWQVGAGATVLFGLAPVPAWGPVLGTELSWVWGPRWGVRLSAERSLTQTFDAPPARAALELAMVRGALCAYGLELGRMLLHGCAQGAYGWFEATGVPAGPITQTRRVTGSWLSVGPSLGVGVALPERLELDFDLALPVPMLRERLVFRVPDATVHQTWEVTGAMTITLRGALQGSDRQPGGIAH